MTTSQWIYPNEVFAAIEHAKSKNPKDEYGDAAFRVDIEGIRLAKHATRFFGFNILKNMGGKWEYIPLIMKVQNLCTTSHLLPDGHLKKANPGHQLQFRKEIAKFVRKFDNGKQECIEEYGKAIDAVYDAFDRIMNRLLDAKKVFNNPRNITSIIQKERIIDHVSKQKTALDEKDHIIRVNIPFKKDENQKIQPGELPGCDVYDLSVKLKRPVRADALPFLLGAFKLPERDERKELNYGNIHEFIKAGSSVSGLQDMSNGCLSSKGVSLPCKWSLLTVKKSMGRKPSATSVFSTEDISEIQDAETESYDEETESGSPGPSTSTTTTSSGVPVEKLGGDDASDLDAAIAAASNDDDEINDIAD